MEGGPLLVMIANFYPKEFTVSGIFFSPYFVSFLIGLTAAWATAMLLNRFRLSRYFAAPQLVFVALTLIYSVLISTFLIPS